MLVLSRQKDDSVMIGDDLMVTVVELRGGRVAISVGRKTPGDRMARFDPSEPVWLERDQQFPLAPECLLTVIDFRLDKVRLGITVPKEMSVYRKEVYDAIQRENDAAKQQRTNPDDDEGAGSPVPR